MLLAKPHWGPLGFPLRELPLQAICAGHSGQSTPRALMDQHVLLQQEEEGWEEEEDDAQAEGGLQGDLVPLPFLPCCVERCLFAWCRRLPASMSRVLGDGPLHPHHPVLVSLCDFGDLWPKGSCSPLLALA